MCDLRLWSSVRVVPLAVLVQPAARLKSRLWSSTKRRLFEYD